MTDTHAQTKPADPAADDQAGDQAQTWRDDFSRVLSPVFGSPQLDLVRGEGSYVWDASGKKYLDLLAGIAVNALGHAHPAWTAAIAEQASTLGHISNFFTSPAQIGLAEKLHEVLDLPAGSAVFFSNSGTEANEAAFKMARRAAGGGDRHRQNAPRRAGPCARRRWDPWLTPHKIRSDLPLPRRRPSPPAAAACWYPPRPVPARPAFWWSGWWA